MFIFNAYGNTYSVVRSEIETVSSLSITDGLSDLSCAYQVANKELLWSNPNWKDGIWEVVASCPNTYEWIEGNFYD